jgi:hypothetical protein
MRHFLSYNLLRNFINNKFKKSEKINLFVFILLLEFLVFFNYYNFKNTHNF